MKSAYVVPVPYRMPLAKRGLSVKQDLCRCPECTECTECRVLLVLLVLFLSCGFQSYFFIARHWLSSFFFGGGAGVIIVRDKIIDPIYILGLYYSNAYFYAYLMQYAALSVKYEQMTFPVFFNCFSFFLKRFSP